jgi:hypothetical protein
MNYVDYTLSFCKDCKDHIFKELESSTSLNVYPVNGCSQYTGGHTSALTIHSFCVRARIYRQGLVFKLTNSSRKALLTQVRNCLPTYYII